MGNVTAYIVLNGRTCWMTFSSTAMHRKTVSRHVETSTARLATLFGLKCEPVKLTRNVLKVNALFQSARLD